MDQENYVIKEKLSMATTPIEVAVRLSQEVKDSHRGIFYNDAPSHHIHENDFKKLLNKSKTQLWKIDPSKGADIGKDIYRLFNGTGGSLQKFIDESFDTGNPLHLYLNIPSEFDLIPLN